MPGWQQHSSPLSASKLWMTSQWLPQRFNKKFVAQSHHISEWWLPTASHPNTHPDTHIRRNKCSHRTENHILTLDVINGRHTEDHKDQHRDVCAGPLMCHPVTWMSVFHFITIYIANNLLFKKRHSSHTQRFNCKCAEPSHRAFIWRENHNVIPSHPLWHEAMDVYEPIWYLDVSGLALQSLNCNGPVQWLYNIFLELMLIALLYIFRTKAFSIIFYIEGVFFFFFFPLPLPTLFP